MANLSNINGKFVVEQTTGYVGVGTTDPNYPIEVLNASAEIALNASGGSIYRLRSDSASNFIIRKEGVGDRLVINSAGNVGIGTASPGYKLDVSGNVRSSLEIVSNSYIKSTGGSVVRSEFNSSNFSQLESNSSGGLITGRAGGTTTLSLSSYTNSYFNGGNVGIGTTSPSEKLHVVGDQLIFGDLLLEGSANSFRTVSMNTVDGSDNQTLYLCGGQTASTSRGGLVQIAGNEVATTGGSVLLKAGNVSTGDIDFYTANTQRMIINNAGNVGIGTTSPESKLQVAGGIQMADDTDTASAAKVGTMRYRTGTEYVEVTGAELVTNGDFATDTNWTKGTGVTIASGVGTWTNVANNIGLTQSVTFTSNAYYRCNVTVSNYSSGSFRFRYPGISSPRITANGTYSLIIRADQSQNTQLFLQGETNGDANVNFSIDNVSVVEVTAEDASYADMCMQTGASTYEWVNIVRNTY